MVTGAIGTDDESSNIFTARILTGLEASEAPLLITTDPALNDLLIYPNPASLTASIEYTLTSSQSISINLYNLQGELIKTVSNEFQFAGNYTKAFDISKIASGNYIIKLQTTQNINYINFVKN